jgi:hypothetical protein
LIVARVVIVTRLLGPGEPITVVIDDTDVQAQGVARSGHAFRDPRRRRPGRQEDRPGQPVGDRRDRGPVAVLHRTGVQGRY